MVLYVIQYKYIPWVFLKIGNFVNVYNHTHTQTHGHIHKHVHGIIIAVHLKAHIYHILQIVHDGKVLWFLQID